MKTNHKINTEDLLVLAHILNEYQEFEKKLVKNLSPKKQRPFILKLWNITQGNPVLKGKDAKKFYEENKDILNTINTYSNIYRFINYNFDNNGEPTENLTFFKKYLLKNKNHITNIITVLTKLHELGFAKIKFDEQEDFTQKNYKAEPSLEKNTYITYVANPIVIPNYTEHICYKTNNSNYEMKLKVLSEKQPLYVDSITLNSLIFDINTLPKSLDKDEIFEPLAKEKEKNKELRKIIKNSVNINVAISDLERQLQITLATINNLDKVSSKEELIEILTKIKIEIELLKTLGTNYNTEATKDEQNLTIELLEKEKTLYLNRRELSKFDFC